MLYYVIATVATPPAKEVTVMPQVSLYIEQELLNAARKQASNEGASLSKFVSRALFEQTSDKWPQGYWDLFGTLDDDTFVAPSEISYDKDLTRRSF